MAKISPLSLMAALLAGSISTTISADELQEVNVTALRIPVASDSVIGSISALDSSALDMVSAIHIQEALSRLPGVNLHRNNGQEYLPAIRSPVLSGAGACGSFLVAEDGIPLRPAGFCNVNELFESHSEQAASIEVVRGPGNALFGSNALHGVINILEPASFNSAPRIGLEGGANNYGRFSFSSGSETLAMAFTGSSEGGYRNDAGVDQQKLSLRHRIQTTALNITSGMTLINLNQETAGYIEGPDAYKDRALSKTNANPEAYRDAWAMRLWSRFEDSSAEPAWVITPYARVSSMVFFQHFLPGTPIEENGQRSAGVQTAFYQYYDNSRLTSGLDVELVRGWLKQYQTQPTPGSAFLQETIPLGFHYDYEVDAIQATPFLQWDWQPQPRWDISLGLRYEMIRYDYDNRMPDGRTRDDGTPCGFGGCRYTRPADRVDYFHNWSPKVGIQYQLTETDLVFTNIARGFRAPQAVELYRLQRQQQVADLDSERLDSIELGFRNTGGDFRYELVAYAMEKDNLIFRDVDFFTLSDGKSRHYGIELALSYQLSRTLDVTLTATEARHEYAYREILSGINIDGNDIDTAPRHFGTLLLGWNPLEASRIEMEWQHVGSYYTDPENLNAYSGHDIVNLRGRTAVSPSLTLSARVTNLFDRRYAERADYTSFGGDRYFPGEPRGLYIGAEFTW
ncbi:MAG: TonB-dependent receptor [Porticoccaceae bacterium]